MTKKDFWVIANAIFMSHLKQEQAHQIAHEIADALEAVYPNFDREKFLKVCGVE